MQTKRTWRTVLRAFWTALRMTLRGETYTPPPPAYPELRLWAEQGRGLLMAVLQAAEQAGLDETARKEKQLILDGRPISMQTILAAVQHNLTREYPSLLDAKLEHSLLTLAAFNLNDRYRLTELAKSLSGYPDIQAAITILESHLTAVPRLKSQ